MRRRNKILVTLNDVERERLEAFAKRLAMRPAEVARLLCAGIIAHPHNVPVVAASATGTT